MDTHCSIQYCFIACMNFPATQRHEGDIAYFTSAEELAEHARNRAAGDEASIPAGDDPEENKRRRRGATAEANLLWPKGIIYYSMSDHFTGACV